MLPRFSRWRATCSLLTLAGTACFRGRTSNFTRRSCGDCPAWTSRLRAESRHSPISSAFRPPAPSSARRCGKAVSRSMRPLALPARRIIPCLDVKDGRVVKGVQFRDHRDAGDIVEQAMRYRDEGADELVFYDITASAEGRSLDIGWVEQIARIIDIPFSVAGGVRSRDQAAACLDAGADKGSIHSPAIERPELIDELARDFGSQCVILGVDSYFDGSTYRAKQYTGSPGSARDSGMETLEWVREASDRGAGEIVLNCMRNDGVRTGYDIIHTLAVVNRVTVPVIASGGAGTPDHFREVFDIGASGALAATGFHDRLIAIPELKEFLGTCGI